MDVETIGLIIPTVKENDIHTWERAVTFPSITMETVASSLTKEADITIMDENSQPLDEDKHFDLVGISINTATAMRGYGLAEQYRKDGSYVVIGGIHASVMPEEALHYADAVVIGEAEGAFDKLIHDLLEGNPEKIYKNTAPIDLATIRPPRRDLHVKAGGLEVPVVEASRGCNNSCSFCYHLPYAMRPAEKVVEEVSALDSKMFSFSDLNIGHDRSAAIELFRQLALAGKEWFGETQSTGLGDERFVREASVSGGIALFVGYESFARESIKMAGKGFNNPERYKEGVERAHEYGFVVKGSFIFGFDTDTPDVFEQTAESAIDLGLDLAVFNVLVPYPGTGMFNHLKTQDRLLYTSFPEDWARYDRKNAVFMPKQMTPEKLMEGVEYVWKAFHSGKSIEKRFPQERRDINWQTEQAYKMNIAAHAALNR